MSATFNNVGININNTGKYKVITIKDNNFNSQQYNELKQIYKDLGFANCKGINNKNYIDIYYNTKNLKNLNEYLSEIYITKTEFIALAEAIYDCIKKCKKNNILNESNIILNEENIYINPVNEKIYLIYIPMNKSVRNYGIKDLVNTLKNLIINTVQIRNGDWDFREYMLDKINEQELELLERTKIREPIKNKKIDDSLNRDYKNIENTYDDYEYTDKSEKGLNILFNDIIRKKLIDIKDDVLNNIKNIILDNEIYTDDTVILNNKYGYLVEYKNMYTKRIEINKDEFIIGRYKDIVDYNISNRSIGKKHAKIIKIGDQFYLIDLNSKNGTYIDSNKLKPNIPYEIKHCSEIVFSNVKYTFEVIDSKDTYT